MLMPCPVASIVKLPGEVLAIAGSVLASVISPLTLKLIVSCPVPAAQVLLASEVLLLALLIAARRLHSEGFPGSSVVLTMIVLPPACSSDWITMTHTGANTISSATSNPGRTIAFEALRLNATTRTRTRAKRSDMPRQDLDQTPLAPLCNDRFRSEPAEDRPLLEFESRSIEFVQSKQLQIFKEAIIF